MPQVPFKAVVYLLLLITSMAVTVEVRAQQTPSHVPQNNRVSQIPSLDNNPFANQFSKAYEGIGVQSNQPSTKADDEHPNPIRNAEKAAAPVTLSRVITISGALSPPLSTANETPLSKSNETPLSKSNETLAAIGSEQVSNRRAYVESPSNDRVSPQIRELNQTEEAPKQGLFEIPTPSPQEVVGKIQSADSIAWWKSFVQVPLREGANPLLVDSNSLVYSALKQSPRIRALSQNPLIREVQVAEAEAAFDPVTFLQTQFQDRADPVGDNLSVTNDGTPYIDDHIWTGDAGLRQKLETGASVELSQRLGFRNSNTAIFNPQDQGTATLALNVTQPLLRGRGKYVNRSQILIAQKSTDIAWNTFQGELQNEIQKTVEAYWRLYFDRCVYLQKQRNVERASIILAKLEGRSNLDSLPSQIARAKSAVFSRKTDLANARRDIRNSETELRRLIADSDWQASQLIELLPAELPTLGGPDYDLMQVITTALENRNEIKETLQRVRIAAVQKDISTNELLPELSFLLGTYVSTLQGETDIADAWADQFAGGGVKPGYSVGLEFEVPIGNRAARSRLTQRKLQLNKIKAEVDESIQNVIAESQIALRRVQSARETLLAASEAIVAAQMDLDQNIGRWESFALVEGDITEGQTPTTMLDQLLDSQERLTASELVYAQAELELKVSETSLQRTMGTLLIQRNVNFGRYEEEGTPAIDLH